MQALVHDDTVQSVKLKKDHDYEGMVLTQLSACSEALRWADAQLDRVSDAWSVRNARLHTATAEMRCIVSWHATQPLHAETECPCPYWSLSTRPSSPSADSCMVC